MLAGSKTAPAGRYFPVTRFRQLVIDLMHFSAQVPSVTVERRMELARLCASRHACRVRPSWSAILIKAFAIVAARMPLLRTTYLAWPWPRYYEHAHNIATLCVDRSCADDRLVLHVQVPSPERLGLADIDAIIAAHQQTPLAQLPSYRHAARLSRVPWPLRRLVWHLGLNWLGPLRCHFFGTFGITSVCAYGASLLNLVPLLTATLHYGMLDDAGTLEMRLSFDHRVFDGAFGADALAQMQAVLNDELLGECETLAITGSPDNQAASGVAGVPQAMSANSSN